MRKIISSILTIALMFGLVFVFSGCSEKSAYTYEGDSNYLSGNFTVDASEVKVVNVDWVSGDVKVEVVEGLEKMVVEETSRYTILEDEALRYNLSEDGVLTVKFRASSTKKVNLTKVKSLKIQLPRAKYITGNLIINSVSADIHIDRAEPATFTISSVSGETTIINSRASVAELTTISGEISLKNSALYDLTINTTSGDVETLDLTSEKIDFSGISGKFNADIVTTPLSINAESTSGDITMKFVNSKGFTAEVETVSGAFNCGFATTYSEGKYVYLDGIYNYRFETVSGNINLEKK